jgi:hypothetical protein
MLRIGRSKTLIATMAVALALIAAAVAMAGSAPKHNAPFVPCWSDLPNSGGVAKGKIEPNRCLFLPPGARSFAEGVSMRSLEWKHWGAKHAKGVGEVCAAGCSDATVILHSLSYSRRCVLRAYTRATFVVDGVEQGDLRLAGCGPP